MREYGVYYDNKTNTSNNVYNGDSKAVYDVLKSLHEGYQKRDPKLGDEYLKKLFINNDSVYVLGTASDELCPGLDEVKDLLESDWEYWGNAGFVLDEAIINIDGDVAWFSVPGTVQYSFEHTQKRYDGYVEFAKEKANDKSMSAEKRIALINWAMALTYHQQTLDKRDYDCPMRLTGVMVKEKKEWKIASGHFSMPKGVFADQRLESNQEFIDEMKADQEAFSTYGTEEVSSGVEALINDFTKECIGTKLVSDDTYKKYFSNHQSVHVISPDTEWFVGEDQIIKFLESCHSSEMILETSSAITRTRNEKTWVTGIGTIQQTISKEELAERALAALNEICDSEITSQEKLYHLHRQVAYALKEASDGDVFTCPIRYSMMLTNIDGKEVFEQLHFSYPFYWIFEGKLDTVQ